MGINSSKPCNIILELTMAKWDSMVIGVIYVLLDVQDIHDQLHSIMNYLGNSIIPQNSMAI